MKKPYSQSTLERFTKKELIEYIRMLEYNNENMRQNFDIQYKNCLELVNQMNILNDTYRKATSK